jgi:hypothetical protein
MSPQAFEPKKGVLQNRSFCNTLFFSQFIAQGHAETL